MNDPNSEIAKPYIDAIKSSWTFSSIEFIKYEDQPKNIEPGTTFLSLGGHKTNTRMVKEHNNFQETMVNYENTHMFLQFWTTGKGIATTADKANDNFIPLARIELFLDFETLTYPQWIIDSDLDLGGHVRNWSPGILKNYIKCMMSYLDTKKERTLYDDYVDRDAIKKLRSEALYIPESTFIAFNMFSGDETEKIPEPKLFGGYPYPYKILSDKELSDKIINGKDDFYYLIYVKGSTQKYVSVFNSKTGEMIYTHYKSFSYNIGNKDIKKLAKEIKKK